MTRFIYLAALIALFLLPGKTAPVPNPLPFESKRGCTDYTTWPRKDIAAEEACIWTVWKF